jgi:hypothetical protein
MTVTALMVLLVIGGGTTVAYLLGQRQRTPAVARGQASWQRTRPDATDQGNEQLRQIA